MSELSPTPQTLPLLPLRDVVVFPHMVIPLFVGRPKSIKALEAAMEVGKSIMLVAQKNASKDEPSASDIYEIGCVSNILQMLKLPDGTVKVLVEGTQRALLGSIVTKGEMFVASARTVASSVARLTLASATPGTALSAFSTRMTQDAQVMPATWSRVSCSLVGVAVLMGLSGLFDVLASSSFQLWQGQARCGNLYQAPRVS